MSLNMDFLIPPSHALEMINLIVESDLASAENIARNIMAKKGMKVYAGDRINNVVREF